MYLCCWVCNYVYTTKFLVTLSLCLFMFMKKVTCFMTRGLLIAVQFQGGNDLENFGSSVLPFQQQFSGGAKHSTAIGTMESFYPDTGMHSDNIWIQSTQMNEAMQLGNTTYYPHLAGYSTEVVGSHYEPEGMQMANYLSGFEPAFQSISQSTGTGLPPKEGNFQNSMRRQSYPPSGNRYDRPYQ